MRKILTLVCVASCLALICAPSAGRAQEPAGEPSFVFDIWSETCTVDSATSVTFRGVSSPVTQEKDCVRIDGLWDGLRVYENLDAWYALSGVPGMPEDEPPPGRLGVYGVRDRIPMPARPTFATLAGKAGRCSREVWMGGYCHHFGGAYIALGQARLHEPSPERLTGAAQRARVGHLKDLPQDSPVHAAGMNDAQAWLLMLQNGDEAAYAAAWGLEEDLTFPDQEDTDLYKLFRRPESPFRILATQNDTEIRLFGYAKDADAGSADDFGVFACFMIGRWTEDRWPVSELDAAPSLERPYVCVSLSHEIVDGEIVKRAEMWANTSSLAEPRWPD